MLSLPFHRATTFVLVHPHYPENVGAAARAMKTQGFTQLVLVKPSKLAAPESEAARKMAVKSCDVLEAARVVDSLQEVASDDTLIVTTTSRRGVSGVLTLRQAARELAPITFGGQNIAVVLGNEKTGLSADDLWRADYRLRIPMADDQPSINLAQAVQLIAYEFFVAALEARGAEAFQEEAQP